MEVLSSGTVCDWCRIYALQKMSFKPISLLFAKRVCLFRKIHRVTKNVLGVIEGFQEEQHHLLLILK